MNNEKKPEISSFELQAIREGYNSLREKTTIENLVNNLPNSRDLSISENSSESVRRYDLLSYLEDETEKSVFVASNKK